MLKYIYQDDFREQLYKMIGILQELASKATGMEYLETLLRYIINATDKINEEDMKEIIIKTLPKGGDRIMQTLAEKWIAQGMQEGMELGMEQGIEKGMEKGIRQGLLEAIQLGLELKFGMNGLALYADISKIDDNARLRSIKEAIVIARDIEEIQRFVQG